MAGNAVEKRLDGSVNGFQAAPNIGGSLKICGGVGWVLGTRNAGFVGWALAAHALHVCPKAANRAGNKCPPYGNWCFFPPEGSLKRVGINAHPTKNGMVCINSCA